MPIIADIQRYAVIAVLHPVGHQAGQILQRIQRIAAMADDEAEVLAFQRQYTAVFLFLHGDGRAFRAHAFEQLSQVFLRSRSRCNFHKYPYPRGASAKQAERLFLRGLQDFHLHFVRREAEFRGSSLPGFLYRGGFLDRFLEHDSTSLSLLVVSLCGSARCFGEAEQRRFRCFKLILLFSQPVLQPVQNLPSFPPAAGSNFPARQLFHRHSPRGA